jgi:hypothetical protein
MILVKTAYSPPLFGILDPTNIYYYKANILNECGATSHLLKTCLNLL